MPDYERFSYYTMIATGGWHRVRFLGRPHALIEHPQHRGARRT